MSNYIPATCRICPAVDWGWSWAGQQAV